MRDQLDEEREARNEVGYIIIEACPVSAHNAGNASSEQGAAGVSTVALEVRERGHAQSG